MSFIRKKRSGLECLARYVPSQRPSPGRVAIRVAAARPRRLVIGARKIIPDKGFAIFCALIDTPGYRMRQQKQRNANKTGSRGHDSVFSVESDGGTIINADMELARVIQNLEKVF